MVAQLLGLRLRVIAGAFRRSPLQILGLVLGLLYGAALTLIVVVALIGARFAADIELVRNLVVVAGSATTLGFLLLPMVFGVDNALDPRSFALFGISNRRLSLGLAVTALLGIPTLVLGVCALATIVTWSRSVISTLIAILAAAIAIATCALAARVMSSVAAFFLATRRARDITGLLGLVVIVMISPVVLLLINVDWIRDGVAVLRGIAGVASWTPLGAMWSAPGDAALGHLGAAVLKLAIAIAFLGILWLAWQSLVARMLVTPGREVQGKAYAGLGWFGRLPGNPAGAIAARSLTYWGRDARYWMSLVMIPVVPAIAVIALLVVGVIPVHYVALFALPIMCLFLGWGLHNDVSHDGTAVWLHLASGTRGWADRIGRLIPILAIGIPLIAVGSIVTVMVYGDWGVLTAVIGLSSCTLLVGVGLSSFTSSLFPYPAPKPGDSPFQQPQHTGALAAAVQSISFALIIALSAPPAVFLVLGVLADPGWLSASLYSGIAIGVGVAVLGVWSGGAVFDRRGPEIMAATLKTA